MPPPLSVPSPSLLVKLENKNGKDFENQAIQKGANVIISENEFTNCVSEIVYIRVKNIRNVCTNNFLLILTYI